LFIFIAGFLQQCGAHPMGGGTGRQAHGLRPAPGSARWRANAIEGSRVPDFLMTVLRRFGAIVLLLSLLGGGAIAQPLTGAEIAKMDGKALDNYIATVTATVVQDSVRLSAMAQAGNCPELSRAGNSLALAYDTYALVRDATAGQTGPEAAGRRSRLVQSRVIAFAARVRVGDLLAGRCSSYQPTGEQADDPRYQRVERLPDSAFTAAIIDARFAAETNLAIAAAARQSKDCRVVGNAIRSIQLIVPYLEKLALDVASRPLALGPLASKRGLEQVRNQSVSAANQLDREFATTCGESAPTETPRDQPVDSTS
jgi:hypothetical protein